jgi:hypothetical protein
MKKIIVIAILMVTVVFAQGQRRYGFFTVGGMSPIELSNQIDKQISNLQKDLKVLTKEFKVLNLRSQRRKDLMADTMLNENLARRGFLVLQIEKLIEQKNELLVSNTPAVAIRVNTKDPVAMATAYYMIKVADGYSNAEQAGNQKGFKGILVNEWNHNVQAVVTGPGNFKKEFNLSAGKTRSSIVQEFNFQIPGKYTVTFRASNTQARSITKDGGMPNNFYYHNGRQYSFKATQFSRF